MRWFLTAALVVGLLKLLSASSETGYEAALQKAEEPCSSYKKETYDSIWEFSLGEDRKKEEKMLSYITGQSQATLTTLQKKGCRRQ